MHPLRPYALPLGIALVVLAFLWLVLGIDYVIQFWPALAIALGIAGALWVFASAGVRGALEGFLGVPFVRGVLIAALLTAVYAGILIAAYTLGVDWFKKQFGIDLWWARFWVTVAIPFTIPAILRLYAATGLPGDPVQIGRALRVFVVLYLIFLGWLNFDVIVGRLGRQIGVVRSRPAVVSVVPTFPLQYASLQRVGGSLAPRATPPTIVEKKADDLWMVSIDGTNEYGYREPNGHRTGIIVKTNERVTVRHLGGIPAANDHGDRFTLCGIKRRIYPGEKFRFPEKLYGVWIGFAAGDKFRLTGWPCGEKENEYRNETGIEVELIFFFNTNEVYRTADGAVHDYGFAYAGWDGERARFEVRMLKNPASSS